MGKATPPIPPATFGGPCSQSLKNIKYIRMRRFKKNNSKISSSKRPRENVSLGPAMVLDGPAISVYFLHLSPCFCSSGPYF